MKVLAVNGGPRKSWNTAKLLEHALEGARSIGAEIDLVHLYDLVYQGCTSCFGCKRRELDRAGQCLMRDDLTPVLERAWASDVLLIGSPIYFSDVTGMMRSFLERLLFPNVSYDEYAKTTFAGRVDTACFFTMNLPEHASEYYKPLFESNSSILRLLGGSTEYLASYDTLQFDDYEAYNARLFDAAHKQELRETQFPKDCEAAFAVGARLAGKNR